MEEVKSYLNSIRRDFAGKPLTVSSVEDTPIKQYNKWLDEAVGVEVVDPHAMIVSSINQEGYPSSRVVYLRDIEENGMIFYTNYDSNKGHDIEGEDHVALLFYWVELERQMRFEGKISKVESAISDRYFAARPRQSQIGAWASEQSKEIPNRTYLEDRVTYFNQKFEGKDVPRPEFWGGYRVTIEKAEFWQGRPSRLHDRIVYKAKQDHGWDIYRVAP